MNCQQDTTVHVRLLGMLLTNTCVYSYAVICQNVWSRVKRDPLNSAAHSLCPPPLGTSADLGNDNQHTFV